MSPIDAPVALTLAEAGPTMTGLDQPDVPRRFEVEELEHSIVSPAVNRPTRSRAAPWQGPASEAAARVHGQLLPAHAGPQRPLGGTLAAIVANLIPIRDWPVGHYPDQTRSPGRLLVSRRPDSSGALAKHWPS